MATILITGAAKRIGRAIALDMARNGYDVVIHHHKSFGQAAELVAEITSLGVKAVEVSCDFKNRTEVAQLLFNAQKAIGSSIDILINNAAVYEKDTFDTVTDESWDLHMGVNLHAPFVLAQAYAKSLPDNIQGNIINIIDQRVWKLNPKFMSYTLSKSGLWTLTQTMAQALAPNIRVNAIGPGPTLASKHQKRDSFTSEEKNVLLKTGPKLEEISAAIQFILNSPSLTGQMIALDGGQHLAWQTPDINIDE